MNYVAGFVFSADRKNIVLIRKNKPLWQMGKLNGVGGKLLKCEPPQAGMYREFLEEAGVGVSLDRWREFCVLRGDFGAVHFFMLIDQDVYDFARTTEKEKIVKVPVKNLERRKIIPNLKWLIPMALSETEIVTAEVQVASDPTD